MNTRALCFNFYERAEKVIVPSLRYSQSVYEDILGRHATGAEAWLDLGCGRRMLPPWRLRQEQLLASGPRLLAGLDRDYDSLRDNATVHYRICGDIGRLPFRSGAFDLITSNMVFEHLADPERELSEIYRILKPDGRLIFHTPNAHGYIVLLSRAVPEFLKKRLIRFLEEREQEDVFPTHYRINTRRKIKKLAGGAGFRIAEIRLIPTSCQFSIIPPLAVIELFWLRLLMTKYGEPLRTNIIVILRKPGGRAARRAETARSCE